MPERAERISTHKIGRIGRNPMIHISALAGLVSGAVVSCTGKKEPNVGVLTSPLTSSLNTPAPKPVVFPQSINWLPQNGFSSATEAKPRDVLDFNGKPIPGRITMPFGALPQDPMSPLSDVRRAELSLSDKNGGVAYTVQGSVPYAAGLKNGASDIETVGFGGKVVRTIVRDDGGAIYENGVSIWSNGRVASISPSTVPGTLKICAEVEYPGQVRLTTDPWNVNIDRNDQFKTDWYKGLLADIAAALAKDIRNVPARQKLIEAGLLDPLSSDNTDEIEAPETEDGKGSVFEAVTIADSLNNLNRTRFYSGPKGKPKTSLRYDPNMGPLGTWVQDALKSTEMTADGAGGHMNATHLTQTAGGTSTIEVIVGDSDMSANFLTVTNLKPLGAGKYEHLATTMDPDSAAADDDRDGRSNQAELANGGLPNLADDGVLDKNGVPVAGAFKDCDMPHNDANGEVISICTSVAKTAHATYDRARLSIADGSTIHYNSVDNTPPVVNNAHQLTAQAKPILIVHTSPDGKAPTPSFSVTYQMGNVPHMVTHATNKLDGTAAKARFDWRNWPDMPNAPLKTDWIPPMGVDYQPIAGYPASVGDELGLEGSTVEVWHGNEQLVPDWDKKDMGVDAGPDMSMPKDGGADMAQNPDMAENTDFARMMPQMDLSVAPDLTAPLDMTVAPDLASLPPDLRQMMRDLAADPVNDMISPPAVDAGQSPDGADTDGAAGDNENNNGGGGCGCKIGGQHNHGKDGTPIPAELGAAVLALGALRKRRSFGGLVQKARSGVARALGFAA